MSTPEPRETTEAERRFPSPSTEVDRLAVLLMAAWERAEEKPVNVSYVATFVDMARAVLAGSSASVPGPTRAAEGLLRRWSARSEKGQRDGLMPVLSYGAAAAELATALGLETSDDLRAALEATEGEGEAGAAGLTEAERKRLTRSVDNSMRRWVDAHPEYDRGAIETVIPHLTDIAVERFAARSGGAR